MKALIVGFGKVGRPFVKMLQEALPVKFEVEIFRGRRADSSFEKTLIGVDIVCIAIPTKDDGSIALGYMLAALKAGIPVVTCEKGSLAFHFPELKPYLSRIGFTATVGGGSGMMCLVRDYSVCVDPIKEIHAIVNGTINFLLWRIPQVKYVGLAIAEAIEKELPEPGAFSLFEIFNAEIADCIMKSCILFNVGGLGESIQPNQFTRREIGETELRMITRAKTDIRFVISITKPSKAELAQPNADVFVLFQDPWLIRGRFMRNAKLRFGTQVIKAQNALVVEREITGSAMVIGVGAGSIPTAAAMADDVQRLLKLNTNK